MQDNTKIINSWLVSSEKDFEIAKRLLKSKDYSYALFFCHLSLEKLLKALIIKKKNELPPPIHLLVRLANLSGIKFSKDQLDDLAEITTFNIRARYDDYKLKFYKKATKIYTVKYFKKVAELRDFMKDL
jgi:HEPN domain-containing protein